MSWQHPQNGDTAPQVYRVYDAETMAGAYEQYADPAAAHGWYEQPPAPASGHAYTEELYGDPAYAEAPDDLISTAPLAAVAAPDAPGDSAVFVDGSGRRRRLVRRIAIGMGAACVVFLGVVIAGLFGSGPSGGPLPWGHGKDDAKAPRAEHSPSASPTEHPGTSARPAAPAAVDQSATGSPGAAKSDRPSGKATSDSATSPAPTTTAPSTAAPSAAGPANGNATDNPGRGHGTGSTKGPK
ncbi:hypothetical protein [Streptomyces sp. NBC_00063]|uniref:hypothetical protein n=1 Tax=Streptomyces sp. NBC_00063 TaxID=2975638 RepID=UPI003D70E88C